MSEDRKKILDMLAAGKISVDDAEKLLNAVDADASPNTSTESQTKDSQSSSPDFLIVNVEPKTEGGDVVNIKVPIKLLIAGVKLASLLPNDVQTKVSDAAEENGVDLGFDFKKLNGDNPGELIAALSDLKVDIDNENERVRIFCQ
ncbi:MAG: hypothetical protein CMQ15_17370 [Gammaproteobacteria bacterium]|jgi:hypothetical protein|nr:hypothetical protein [Gammaproteobacteria bacterium]HJN94185.1 hypothetical protein [Gammaproteobacteria bacterium]|tara:strand:- start:142494 stop:142928 length:435 start_codon:yes stop_codon:yes gene_type:complete